MPYLRKIGPNEFLTTESVPFYQPVSDGMLSVAIASRFLRKPDNTLWLADAVQSIHQQSKLQSRAFEIIVGIDADAVIPPDAENLPATFAYAEPLDLPSQSSSLNAALRLAAGDILGFLDDDDQWFPERLTHGLADLQYADVISATATNYNLHTGDGSGTNHYSTPSGWLMRRETQMALGFLDSQIRHFVDCEYIGRINRAGMLRIMQTTARHTNIKALTPNLQSFLKCAPLGSALHILPESAGLIFKTIHENTLTAQAATQQSELAKQHSEIIFERYGHRTY